MSVRSAMPIGRIAFMMAPLLVASAASAQSLEQVLVEVYEQNPQLLAERAQLRATDEGVSQARGGWRPTVTAQVSGGYSNAQQTQTSSVFGPSEFAQSLSPSTYGLTLTQPVYLGGKTTASIAKARQLVMAETANLESVEQSAFLAAATDYADVAAAQQTYDLSVRHEGDLQRDLNSVTLRFQTGELTKTDQAEAQAAVAEGVSSEADAAASLQVALDAYERDIGDRPGHLDAPDFDPVLPNTKEDLTGVALTGNPDVLAARYAAQAAQSDVRVVRSQLLPSITLNATAERATNPGLQLSRTDQEEVVAQLNVPLYEAGVVYSQTRASEDTVVVKQRDADQAARVARAKAGTAWDQVQAARADVASYQAQIDADTTAVRGVKEESRVGGRSVFDILNQEAALYQAQTGLIRARHDEMVAELNLAAAIGHLTAKALALPVDYYDPGKHLRYVETKWIGLGNPDETANTPQAGAAR